jgi:phosphate-selective porin OprO and OprP
MKVLRSPIHLFSLSLLAAALAAAQGAAPAADPGQQTSASQQPTSAQSTNPDLQQLQKGIDQLSQKVKDLEQKAELKKVEDAAAAEKAKTQANVTADLTGFTIASPHGNFVLKIGADLQVDNRSYFGINSGNPMDTMILRRVRPTFTGTVYHWVDYFFRPDFGQGTTVIYDAYVELKYFNFAKIRAGKFQARRRPRAPAVG